MLAERYLAAVYDIGRQLRGDTIHVAAELAAYPAEIRGYGPVKAAARV